jgi:hypothetical protein
MVLCARTIDCYDNPQIQTVTDNDSLSNKNDALKAINEEYSYIAFITDTYDDCNDPADVYFEEEYECLDDETLENPYSEASPQGIPFRLYREGGAYRSLVFFGISLLTEWSDVHHDVKIEANSRMTGNQFRVKPRYLKISTGLSP